MLSKITLFLQLHRFLPISTAFPTFPLRFRPALYITKRLQAIRFSLVEQPLFACSILVQRLFDPCSIPVRCLFVFVEHELNNCSADVPRCSEMFQLVNDNDPTCRIFGRSPCVCVNQRFVFHPFKHHPIAFIVCVMTACRLCPFRCFIDWIGGRFVSQSI